MREIKFRAWDEGYRQMIFLENSGLQYYDFDGSYSLGFTVDGYSGFWAHEQFEELSRDSNKFPIMQYTGLQDKNGKDIYEGDVIQACWGEEHMGMYEYNIKGVVRFSSGSFNVVCDNVHWYFGEIPEEAVTIIGNIYENPELMED